jgi:hypothetical protein
MTKDSELVLKASQDFGQLVQHWEFQWWAPTTALQSPKKSISDMLERQSWMGDG